MVNTYKEIHNSLKKPPEILHLKCFINYIVILKKWQKVTQFAIILFFEYLFIHLFFLREFNCKQKITTFFTYTKLYLSSFISYIRCNSWNKIFFCQVLKMYRLAVYTFSTVGVKKQYFFNNFWLLFFKNICIIHIRLKRCKFSNSLIFFNKNQNIKR